MNKLRTNILSLLLVLLPVALWAQPRVQRHVALGVIGGTSMSNYSLEPKVTQNNSLGYTVGVGARYIEEKFFGLQVELELTRRGMKDRYDSHPEFNFERQLTYVEMPLMAHVYFEIGKKNEVALDLGPKLGYYLWDKTKGNTENNPDFEAFASHTYHGYQHHVYPVDQKFDYGIQAGLGYEFKMNKDFSLQLQGRYYFGLGNIFPDTKADTFSNSANHNLQIVLALWFHKKIGKFK